MGARRAAIQASGVGKTDLAVPTPDGVKEAKNRRACDRTYSVVVISARAGHVFEL